ncbi:hypothetical protein HDU76_007721, partial [Blyttiomyces sp. JEL0837]
SNSQPFNNAKLTRVGQLREHLLSEGPAPSIVRSPFQQFDQSSNVHIDEESYTSSDQLYKLKCTVILDPATSIDTKTSTATDIDIDAQDEHPHRKHEKVVIQKQYQDPQATIFVAIPNNPHYQNGINIQWSLKPAYLIKTVETIAPVQHGYINPDSTTTTTTTSRSMNPVAVFSQNTQLLLKIVLSADPKYLLQDLRQQQRRAQLSFPPQNGQYFLPRRNYDIGTEPWLAPATSKLGEITLEFTPSTSATKQAYIVYKKPAIRPRNFTSVYADYGLSEGCVTRVRLDRCGVVQHMEKPGLWDSACDVNVSGGPMRVEKEVKGNDWRRDGVLGGDGVDEIGVGSNESCDDLIPSYLPDINHKNNDNDHEPEPEPEPETKPKLDNEAEYGAENETGTDNENDNDDLFNFVNEEPSLPPLPAKSARKITLKRPGTKSKIVKHVSFSSVNDYQEHSQAFSSSVWLFDEEYEEEVESDVDEAMEVQNAESSNAMETENLADNTGLNKLNDTIDKRTRTHEKIPTTDSEHVARNDDDNNTTTRLHDENAMMKDQEQLHATVANPTETATIPANTTTTQVPSAMDIVDQSTWARSVKKTKDFFVSGIDLVKS